MDEEVGARAQAKKKKAKKKKKKKKRKKAKKKKVRFPGGKRKKGQHKSPLAFLLDEANARGLGQNVVSHVIVSTQYYKYSSRINRIHTRSESALDWCELSLCWPICCRTRYVV